MIKTINQHTDATAFTPFLDAQRWVAWSNEKRGEDLTKVPYCLKGKAKANDPSTWLHYGDAKRLAADRSHDGVGIELGQLENGDYLIGLDLDTCRDPETGRLEAWASRAVQVFSSYTEVSPSMTGLKVFALAAESAIEAIRQELTPAGGKTWKGGTGKHPPCIDLYTAGRYFTVTGLHLDGTPNTIERVAEAQLRELIDEVGPALSGKPAPQKLADRAAGTNSPPRRTSGWDALSVWASSGASHNQVAALQLIATGYFSGQADRSQSGCEFAFAKVCKAAGLSQAQFEEAIAEWSDRSFGYGRSDSRPVHERHRAWQRCWANVKTNQDWPEPELLAIDEGIPAEFPISALPLMMREAAVDIQKGTKAPPAMAAASVLAASSFAVQNHFDVAFKGGTRCPLSLMIMTIAASGERKSSVDRLALIGVHDYQKQKHREYEKREKEILEAKKAGLDPSPSLPEPSAILANATLQGIYRSFHEGQPSLALFSDEGGEFLGGHSMKSENRLGSLAGLSKFWDGTNLSYKLRGTGQKSETLRARAPRLAVHLQAQPVAIMPFLADPLARGQGLLARMLIHKPASRIGKRQQSYEEWCTDVMTTAIKSFALRIEDKASLPFSRNEDGEVERLLITLEPEADRALYNYAEEIERQLAPSGDFAGRSDLINKMAEQAVRIAGVFAAFDGWKSVNEERMRGAIDVASYFLSETIRLARLAPQQQEEGLNDAMTIARWLHERGGKETNTNLNNSLPNHLRRKKARERPLELLVDAGWVRKDGTSWILSPKVPAAWLRPEHTNADGV